MNLNNQSSRQSKALYLLEISNLPGDPQMKPNLDSKLGHYPLHTAFLPVHCIVTNFYRTDFTSLSFEISPQIILTEE